MNKRYRDIITLPRHISKTRAPMPIKNRAAQFAPFAALTGFEDCIGEADRANLEKYEQTYIQVDSGKQ